MRRWRRFKYSVERLIRRIRYPNAITHVVSTDTEMRTAFKESKSGDTIFIRPGEYRP